MKNIKLALAVLTFSIIPLSASHAKNATEGSISKGGDERAIEFKSLEKLALKDVRKEGKRAPFKPDIKAFQEKWRSVTVLTETDPKLFIVDGHLKDAVSFPEKNTIYLYDKGWDHITSTGRKVALAVHEVSIQLGWEDNNVYTLSSLVMAREIEKEEGRSLSPAELLAEIAGLDESMRAREQTIADNEREIDRLEAQSELLKSKADKHEAEFRSSMQDLQEAKSRYERDMKQVADYYGCLNSNDALIYQGITSDEIHAGFLAMFSESETPEAKSFKAKYAANALKVCGQAP
jgi:hypothetical protein